MQAINETMATSGTGLWSNEKRKVKVIGLKVCRSIAHDGGELQVYFDTETWNNGQHGLIYTDKGFKSALRKYLRSAGHDAADVGYSEQGMQGCNFVSFDVGPKFLKTWTAD